MHEDKSPQFILKHRLVGAAVLLSFGAFFIPWLLTSGDSKEQAGPHQNVSSAAEIERELLSRQYVNPDARPVTGSENPVAGVVESMTLPTASAREPGNLFAANTATTTNTADKKSWVVQVGVFARKSNAEKLVKKLSAQGFAVNTGKIKIKSGEATKVWVGPYTDHNSAVAASQNLSDKFGEPGFIIVYP